jgi:fluoride exporter
VTIDWRLLGAILVGGGIGSVARYLVTLAVTQKMGPGFPWATLSINIAGSIIIGIVFEMSHTRMLGMSTLARVFLMTGVLGGFTTFSTYSLDIVMLASERAFLLAAAYALGSVLSGFIGAYAGIVFVRSLR